MASPTQQIGYDAETQALKYLQNQGYRLVARNWHCRYGELDLIMWDGEELVFVEVRSRKDHEFGYPEETLTRAKRMRLLRSSKEYRHEKKIYGVYWRFDLIAVTGALVDHFRDVIVG